MITPWIIPCSLTVLLPTLNFLWFEPHFFQNLSLIIPNNWWCWKKWSHQTLEQLCFLHLLTLLCQPLSRRLVKHSKMVGVFPSTSLSKFLGRQPAWSFSLRHCYLCPHDIPKVLCSPELCSWCFLLQHCTHKVHIFMVSNKAQVISACLDIKGNGNNMVLVAGKFKFEIQPHHLLTVSSFKKLQCPCLYFPTCEMGGQNIKIINLSSLLGKINKIINMKWIFKCLFLNLSHFFTK